MRSNFKTPLSERGFSLIEVMVAIAVLGIMVYFAMDSVLDAQKSKQRLEIGTLLENQRSLIGHEITNSKSRAKTLEDATNFVKNCDPQVPAVPPPAGCGTDFGGIVRFKDQYDRVIVDTLDPDKGFNMAGQVCDGFDPNPSGGNDLCPFRVEVKWRGTCIPTGTVGACRSPEMFYEVTFFYNPQKNRSVINPAKYSFNQNSFGVLRNTPWLTRNSNFPAVVGEKYFVDTSAGPVIATLPVSASPGDSIFIIDATGSFGTNNLTIAANGHKVMGLAEDMTVSDNNISFELIYFDAANGWRIK